MYSRVKASERIPHIQIEQGIFHRIIVTEQTVNIEHEGVHLIPYAQNTENFRKHCFEPFRQIAARCV